MIKNSKVKKVMFNYTKIDKKKEKNGNLKSFIWVTQFVQHQNIYIMIGGKLK